MPADVRLLFQTEYPEVGGDNPSGTAGYIIRGAATFADAFVAVNTEAPATDATTGLRKIKIKLEEPGPGLFVGYVTYGLQNYITTLADPTSPPPPGSPPPPPPPAEDDPMGGEFSFSTTGGTQHITQSLFTVRTANIAAEGALPFTGRAIGITRDGTIQGVDIVAPKLEFSIAVKPPYLTLKYVKLLRDLTGKTNAGTFWTFPANEVLFMGGDGRTSKSDGASINLHFAAGKTRQPGALDPADSTDISTSPLISFADPIPPWDHVWVMYRDKVSNGVPSQEPFGAFREQVYGEGDYSKLGIG